ncbi:hypothetical protein [Flavobacterium sp. WC2509]|uniref:hypothetical protein n=1 Tax=Flavobacterium sp. WC2509 TaxID=3461406 RepID=UPI004044C69F
MNQTLQRLLDIEKNGYQIDFGNVFEHAFENYKKIALYAGLVILIFIFSFFIFTTISLVSFLDLTTLTKELSPEKLKIENLSQSELLVIGGISLVFSCLFSPFQAAFLKMAHHGDRDEEFTISSLFSYYKMPYLKEIIISTFLISTISFSLTTLLSNVKLEILGTIITYFISFTTILTIPLIIFGNLNAVNAIKHSILIVLKQPFILLGLMIIAIIGAFVGIMACCIGFLFTMPFIYSMNYAIYCAIIGIDNTVEND